MIDDLRIYALYVLKDNKGPKAQTKIISMQQVTDLNQPTVIHAVTTSNILPVIRTKENIIFVTESNSVIQSSQNSNSFQTLELKHEIDNKNEFCADDYALKKRREILIRRPSYRKILNDIAGAEMSFLPVGQLPCHCENIQSLPAMSMPGVIMGENMLQCSTPQDDTFYVQSESEDANNADNKGSMDTPIPEDQMRKREMRLYKNREAAKECRRKKKEYIKCLENRVAVLETQNKALIDELKSLKQLYCQKAALN